MSYYFSKTISSSFEDAIERTKDALRKEGFGVLTEIDIKATLKEKLDVDFQNYRILGACNPSFAYKALLAENKIGTMLPCNVIVQEKADGSIEVSAVDPMESMKAVENADLAAIAGEVRRKLQTVVNNL
ncbi:MAG: DUF302 domain-containing protein [Chloroflexi bacterium]|nr:DUF302 domain-containing protein [Chloroflexota bacterium]MCI0822387.1 DUF302 domain-containing protein [Chloroflexota bacterium]MCI0869073.1 DUF302 domain-containing protein [Chloroflexota bacterium]MCI0887368.1 DUF302 domain-containing protein [Chloroflexota bacterium]